MEPTIELTGIDMNNRANIAIYTQLIRFHADILSEETLFSNPDSAQQRIIQELAHGLGLEFEYSLRTRSAIVSRAAPLDIFNTDGDHNFTALDFDGALSAVTPTRPYQDKLLGGSSNPLSTATSGSSHCAVGETGINHLPDILFGRQSFSLEDAPTDKGVGSRWRSPAPSDYNARWSSRASAERLYDFPSPSTIPEHYTHPSSPGSNYVASPISSASSKRKTSYRIGRTRNLFKRGVSVESSSATVSSGYQEIIFDSCSGRSISTESTCSTRRGSMDSISRAAMKAVKSIGACWRCKFLRKTCDTENPCLACPKSSQKSQKSNWEAVGCKRGEFKDEITLMTICPRSKQDSSARQTKGDGNTWSESLHTESNKYFRSAIELRNEVIESIRTAESPQNKFFEAILRKSDTGSCWKPFHKLQWPQQSCESCEPFLPVVLTPLHEYIIAIVWEAADNTSCHDVFTASQGSKMSSLWDVAVFLRSAASYQAKVDTDELILLSLICLRSCLETLRLSNGGYLEEVHHQSCETERCEIDSVSNLQINMRLYLNELQRVFFKKENMRSKETWWLSAFYSLVIQGFVRRALLKVARKWTLWTVRDESEANDYLQVAVRLFIASSGTYDPLMRDYATFGKEKESKTDKHRLAEDFQAAQLSLHQYKWVSSGTPCTADYLRNLYEIDLEPVDERSLQSTPQRSPRVTPLSLGWTPEYERLYKFVVQKGNEPYFELLPGCLITQHTPERVYLDAPSNSKRNQFPCQYPGTCDDKIFKRPADLERHYKNVHASLDQKDQYPCDYRLCQRIHQPFTRKDHFRDHLRDYHKEDLGCAKGEKFYKREKWLKLQNEWAAEREIHTTWWRCPKCLHKVIISESGYKCGDCKHPCDPERKERIEATRKKLNDEGDGETGDQDDVQESNPKKLDDEEDGETGDQDDVQESNPKKLDDEEDGETGDQDDVQESNPKKLAGEEGGETGDQHDVQDSHLRYPSHCSKCSDTAWVWNMLLGTYDPCTDCQPDCMPSVY